MGITPNNNTWRKGAETVVAANQEKNITLPELVKKYEVQARNFAQAKENAGHVRAFFSQKFHTFVLGAKNKESALNDIRLNQPHLLPDTIEDPKNQRAYIEALAIELSKPEYNQ